MNLPQDMSNIKYVYDSDKLYILSNDNNSIYYY